MTPRPPNHPGQSALQTIAALAPWLLGAAAVALLMLFVDEPVGRWCLANRQVPPLPQFQMTLGYTGAGGVQGPVLLAALLGGVVCSRWAVRLLGIVAATLSATAYLVWAVLSPDGKDAMIALIGLPGFFLIACLCASLIRSTGASRARYLTVCRWLLLTFVLATLITTGLKAAVRRPRPTAMDEPRPTLAVQLDASEWHSFPSGDVLVTAALVLVLWGMLGRPSSLSWLFVFPAIAMVQRLAAAKHFPGDVAGGLLIGLLVGQIILAWVHARGWRPATADSPPRPNEGDAQCG
ncbi:MAG: phosphatase PAP2 family protein [Armatimonadetes bacterium]|nr:phosphatase PAP2 family protein [Armatimonadota bacterium]